MFMFKGNVWQKSLHFDVGQHMHMYNKNKYEPLI